MSQARAPRESLHDHAADAGLALLVILVVGMMIVPLPTWLLDLLIAGNLGLCMLLLVTALYVPQGLAFSTLPTVLLVTTLYRLSLNVSSTRLILLQADAGKVIAAFGDFVVRGNYVVGGVVFLILTIIQYLVVAKGSERVAEVAARFSLDALPGKQLAIDADLRAGALTPEAARERRALLERENQFYGAMDGAMKFVKGDAIAGIVIAVITLCGGTAIGVGMRELSISQSLSTYGLLTIGDGLVSQIPSLVISTAAGLIVTRVAGSSQEKSLGSTVAAQLFADARVLCVTAAFLAALSLVPGLPAMPFLVLALLTAAAARVRFQLTRARTAHDQRQREQTGEPAALRLLLGTELGRQLGATGPGSPLHDRFARLLTRAQDDLGLPELSLQIAIDPVLDPQRYVLFARELPAARGELSLHPQYTASALEDVLRDVLRHRARELLSLQDVRARLDAHATHGKALVTSVLPGTLSLPELTELLRRLLDEQISIKPLTRILEALAAHAGHALPLSTLVERVRAALRELIALRYEQAGVLEIHRIDPLIEDAVRDAVTLGERDHYLALAPDLAKDIVAAVRRAAAQHVGGVLVTQPDIRRFLRELLASELPDTVVLSFPELPVALAVREREPIRI